MLRKEQSFKATVFYCSPEVYWPDTTVSREDFDAYYRNRHFSP